MKGWAAAPVALVLIGCQVPELDPSGRPCPCVSGYTCDATTHTCVASNTAGSTAATTGSGASGGASTSTMASTGPSASSGAAASGGGGAGGAGAGGGGSGGKAVLFDDEFDTDSGVWTPVGAGTWVLTDGEMAQTDETAPLAFDFVPAMASLSDYHIEARMRQLGGNLGGAMEVDFRVSASKPEEQYFCNWQPNDGTFLIMSSTTGYVATELVSTQIDVASLPNYDPYAPVTMKLDVVGNQIHCWVEPIPGADLSAYDPTHTVGSFGLKSYLMAASYDFIRVTEP